MATPGIGAHIPVESPHLSTAAREPRLSRPGGSRGEALARLATNLETDAQERVVKLHKKSFRLPSGKTLKHFGKNVSDNIAGIACGLLKSSQPNKISSPSNSHEQSPQQDFNRPPSEAIYKPSALYWQLKKEGMMEVDQASVQCLAPTSTRESSQAVPATVESQTALSPVEPQPRKFPWILKAVKLRSWNPFKQPSRKTNEYLKEVFNELQKQQIKNSNEMNEIWLSQLSRFGLNAANNQYAVGTVFESLRYGISAFQSRVDTDLFARVMDCLAKLENSLKENVGQTGIAAFNMKLLHAFGLQDAKEQNDVNIAFDKVRSFLEKEGAPGKSYLDQLNDMAKKMTMPELISQPSNDGAQVVANFVKKLCAENQVFFSEALLDQFSRNQMNKGRMDKRETGLANTIIATDNHQLIKLHNSVPLNIFVAERDALQSFTEMLKNDPVQHVKVFEHRTNAHMEKVLLGGGTVGRVRIGENIAKGELRAVKKIEKQEYAEKELAQAKKLKEKLDPSILQHDFLFSEDALENQIGQKGEVKTYITMPLADKGDGYDDLERLSELGSDHASFVDQHFNVVNRWLELGATLQENGMVHTDFKPGNIIGGRIADVDAIMYSPGMFEIGTPVYCPPEASGREVTAAAFNKFNSFSLGIMILESVTGERGPGLSAHRYGYAQGYLNSNPEEASSNGKPYTSYEKGVIQIAKQLAADDPAKRITAEEALRLLKALKKTHHS